MNIENKPRVRDNTDKTYSREDLPEYLQTRENSFRTKREIEMNRREIMELLKRSEDELNYEHL